MQKNRLCRCGLQPSARGRAAGCSPGRQAMNCLGSAGTGTELEMVMELGNETRRGEARRCASSADRVYGQLLSAHNVRGMKNAAWTWNRSLDFLHERILKVSVSRSHRRRRRRRSRLHSCTASPVARGGDAASCELRLKFVGCKIRLIPVSALLI